MDFISNSINIITTSNRGFKELPGSNSTFKKRKLSSDSDGSTYNSERSRKDSFNEDFNELSLNKEIKNSTSLYNTPKLNVGRTIIQNPHTINIPKPLKLGQPKEENTKPSLQNPTKNKDFFFENLIKIGSKDIEGITKYLDLNLNEKLFTWNQMNCLQDEKTDKNRLNLLNNFLNSPLGIPLMNFKSPFMPSSELIQIKGLSEYARYPYSSNFIGPLTKNQRIEKIDKYMDKKRNRKWKHIRYGIRKDLADKRERCQGRFVKTNKSAYRSDGSLDSLKYESGSDSKSSHDDSSLNSMRNKANRINLLDNDMISSNNLGLSDISMKDPDFSE